MAFDINTVTLLGRLTKDPELKQTNSGKNVCTFSIANNTSSDDAKVNYFDIRTWEKSAQNCSQYLKKGSQVAVNGRLKQDRWEGQDGKKNYRVLIEANQVMFIGKSGNTSESNLDEPSNNENQPEPASQPPENLPSIEGYDDINNTPF